MRVVKNGSKTVKIEMEPGERFNVDDQGFAIDSMTLRWNGNDKLKKQLTSALNDVKKYKEADDESYMLCIEAQDRKEEIIHEMFETLPAYRIKRVFVGFNY